MEQLAVLFFNQIFLSHPFFKIFLWVYYASYFFPFFLIYFLRGVELKEFLAVILISLLAGIAIKFLVSRPRPYESFPSIKAFIRKENDPSFPSLHAIIFFSILFCLPKNNKRIFGLLTFLLGVVFPISLMGLGIHYPSDIIASFFLVYVVKLLVNKLLAKNIIKWK